MSNELIQQIQTDPHPVWEADDYTPNIEIYQFLIRSGLPPKMGFNFRGSFYFFRTQAERYQWALGFNAHDDKPTIYQHRRSLEGVGPGLYQYIWANVPSFADRPVAQQGVWYISENRIAADQWDKEHVLFVSCGSWNKDFDREVKSINCIFQMLGHNVIIIKE